MEIADVPSGRRHAAEPLHRPDAGRLRPRRTDRIERAAAWPLSALFLLALVAALRNGVLHHTAALEQGPARRRCAQPGGGRGARAGTPARGIPHVALVTVDAQLSAGARVPVWVDRDGLVAPAPTNASGALLTAVVIG